MAADFRQIISNMGSDINANVLFNTFATGFRPDAAALEFWNNQIATMGPEAALNAFLNPSDPNAPRMAAMSADPDYLRATGQEVAAVDPRAQAMFDVYASGFAPDDTALQFWSQKINDLGYQGALNEFLNPTDTASPRYQAMQADPQYQAQTGSVEDFQKAMGLVGEENRLELDAELRNWYNTYTGGRGMATPVDAYVSMLNGRDGTYFSQDYAAAKQKMLADAQAAGLYGGSPTSTIRYDNWVRTQQANQATIPTGVVTGGTGTTGGGTTGGTTGGGTAGGTTTTPGRAMELFNLYATNYRPDQAALDFWNGRIAAVGFEAARNEFLRPSDPNAPRNTTMFTDPDYLAWKNAQPGTNPPPATVIPGGSTPISNANLTNVLPGGAVESQIASGALPQRVIIGGAPITLGGGISAYPYGTQANADILGLPAQRLQEVAAAGQMPPGLVAQPVNPPGGIGAMPNPFQTITTPTTPFTAPANYNPYANVQYPNPFFVDADKVNPFGSLAGNTAGLNVTNPAVTPPAGTVTPPPAATTPGAGGADTLTGGAGNPEPLFPPD